MRVRDGTRRSSVARAGDRGARSPRRARVASIHGRTRRRPLSDRQYARWLAERRRTAPPIEALREAARQLPYRPHQCDHARPRHRGGLAPPRAGLREGAGLSGLGAVRASTMRYPRPPSAGSWTSTPRRTRACRSPTCRRASASRARRTWGSHGAGRVRRLPGSRRRAVSGRAAGGRPGAQREARDRSRLLRRGQDRARRPARATVLQARLVTGSPAVDELHRPLRGVPPAARRGGRRIPRGARRQPGSRPPPPGDRAHRADRPRAARALRLATVPGSTAHEPLGQAGGDHRGRAAVADALLRRGIHGAVEATAPGRMRRVTRPRRAARLHHRADAGPGDPHAPVHRVAGVADAVSELGAHPRRQRKPGGGVAPLSRDRVGPTTGCWRPRPVQLLGAEQPRSRAGDGRPPAVPEQRHGGDARGLAGRPPQAQPARRDRSGRRPVALPRPPYPARGRVPDGGSLTSPDTPSSISARTRWPGGGWPTSRAT